MESPQRLKRWLESFGRRASVTYTSPVTGNPSISKSGSSAVRRVLRRLRRAIGLILLAAASIYTIALVTVLVVSQQDQRRPVDAIVVLGAAQYNGRPSPVLRARLDHARRLYNEGYATRIVVTGGVGRGDTTSEATVGLHYLLSRDVVPGDVVVQPQGRSTEASITAVADWLVAGGLHNGVLGNGPLPKFLLPPGGR